MTEISAQTQKYPAFKIFDLYDISGIEVKDPGLKSVINLQPKLILKSNGRNVQRFGQTKVNIVERLMNRVAVAGHRGKKHKIIKGLATGKYTKNMMIVLDAFKIIEKKTGKNPVEVLVKAIENSAPRDEITVIEYGGARYPQAVDVSPLRRVNLTLRWMEKRKLLLRHLQKRLCLLQKEVVTVLQLERKMNQKNRLILRDKFKKSDTI